MQGKLPRRDFLRNATAAAGVLGYSPSASASALTSADVTISSVPYTPVPDYPIRPKPYSEVKLKDQFWGRKVRINAEVTIPFEVRKLTENVGGRGLSGNVLEAAILSLKTHPDLKLQVVVDARVQALAQSVDRGNSGFEVAATYFHVTGKRDLLDKAARTAAAIYEDFKLRHPPFSGGERDAINCVQLYRASYEKKHLDLAKHYLDIRGLEDSVNRSRHNQSYKPVLEQSEAVGHAVNWASLMVSLVDVGVLTGLKQYFDAGHRMWQDTVFRKMYVTGGIGSTGNEGFGEAYSLPNINAYSETCAVLMFITLNHRLFLATGDGQYIDVMERGMYNNAIDGVSASGNRFFYVNRLASAGDGRDLRWERASLECCPPNLVRFLASMPGFIYAQGKDGEIYVNLYVSSEAAFTVDGKELSLSMDSEMPWAGRSRLTVSATQSARGTIKLRVPGWAVNRPVPGGLYSYTNKMTGEIGLSVNGAASKAAIDKSGYISLERTWKDGDKIQIEFPFETATLVADDRVKENRGRVAVQKGPIVYCSEWPEAPEGRALTLLFDSKSELMTSFDSEFLGGATLIEGKVKNIADPSSTLKPSRLIPYHLWANRGAGEMSVWLSSREYSIGDIGPAGGLIFYVNPNYAADGWRYLEAAPFDQSSGAKWGCFRKIMAGGRGTAVGTGKQNTLDMLAACTEPESAAYLCANLIINGVPGWFLPSRDELALMYRNLKAKGIGNFHDAGFADNFNYWSSSQQTTDMAAHIDFADNGRQHSDDKDFPRRVRAIRAI